MRTVEIMDTTLRDGEQMKDVSYTAQEKMTIARMLLEEVLVDRVEIASARVSSGEQSALARVVSWASERDLVERIEVLGFVDGGRSVDWIGEAGGRVMNLLAKGSEAHCTKQLGKTRSQHVKDITATVEQALAAGFRCNLYLEDWSNGMLSEPEYVWFVLDGLAGLGIDRFMLPDTLGVLSPSSVERFIASVVERYPDMRVDFHAHDDYGVATANTVAAVEAGASGVHCTVNGMGERAGNAPLDEIVVSLKDFLGVQTSVQERALYSMTHTVEIFSSLRVGFNKPITGLNVFTQTAGIHADGDMKGDLYTGKLRPERFGRRRQYALGKLSGKSNLDYNLKELGIELSPEQKKLVLDRVVELGDRKETITRDDLPYIISDILDAPEDRRFKILACFVVSSLGLKPMATAKLAYRPDAQSEYTEYEESAQGDGGFDALMNALRVIMGRLEMELPALVDYHVNIPAGGRTDALVQCSITWKSDPDMITKGVHSDQVLAAAEAAEKMLNLMAMKENRHE